MPQQTRGYIDVHFNHEKPWSQISSTMHLLERVLRGHRPPFVHRAHTIAQSICRHGRSPKSRGCRQISGRVQAALAHTSARCRAPIQHVRLVANHDRLARCLAASRGSETECATCRKLSGKERQGPLSQRNDHRVLWLRAEPGGLARQTPLEKLLACTEINHLAFEHLL